MTSNQSDISELLDLTALDAIAEPNDKVEECRFFLDLAENELDIKRFRWLISAFLGAAYSYFEICALRAYHCFWHPLSGEPLESSGALDVLRKYVRVVQDRKRPKYVKTSGLHNITKELFEIRKANTHRYPLSIMVSESSLPEGYMLGDIKGKGVPALHFSRQVMKLIEEVNTEIEQYL